MSAEVNHSLGVVGPNAIIQLGNALQAQSKATASAIFSAVELETFLRAPPQEMVDQALVQKLFTALWKEVPTNAPMIAENAGRRTADYILAHRIPAPVRSLLPQMPAFLALCVLLKAIERNAWTFAGSGHCTVTLMPMAIEIGDNPITMPDCIWHQAVFSRFFEVLIRRSVNIQHTSCCLRGDETCRFKIEL